jgi:2-polyprenyl-3-methyl-5-hydroxy-6-metoxy-1,4-benzoquinol methylase
MSETFSFKELDAEGLETLKVISDADNFNNWTFETIKPFCSGAILEIGSGIGNISRRFIESDYDITLSDIRSGYRELLNEKFPQTGKQNKIIELDLAAVNFNIKYKNLLNKFDTVFALNVLEHIREDIEAVENCKSLLKPGGRLIILVPAFASLYNTFDRELHHYKRYGKSDLKYLFEINKLTVEKTFFFNAGGIPGWFISGNLQKNKTIPSSQMKLFNSLVPIFRLADKLFSRSFGLSVVCIGRKQ